MAELPDVLYPEIEPFATGRLKVDEVHEIGWEQCGNPDGVPLVWLHGGPGGANIAQYRCHYDPAFYRIVMFDQRGCGKSTPNAELRNNTTQHLIADTEQLREHLGIDKWLVTGGSWGSTLALAYAQAHPQRVTGLIVCGVWLCRAADFDWDFRGRRFVFPEAFDGLFATVGANDRQTLLERFAARLADPDPEVHMAAAKAWHDGWETGLYLLETLESEEEDCDLALLEGARLSCHYMANGCFLKDGQLLADAPKIAHIPALIVQGRYDMITPPHSAYDLARALPKSELRMVHKAGHTRLEPPLARALVQASEDMKSRMLR